MKTFIFLFIFFTLSVTPALAQKKVAVVKLIRGDVNLLTLGKTTKLAVDEWVEEGAVVKTADKSFVKLVFIDKSQMNVGPNSEMKIESFSGKDSGVIDLVKGKIRSQVTKDYLQIDRNKSKMFIKTNNAVMGVRGTDFMISTNGQTSAVVLFEGEVVFNKLDNPNMLNTNSLENVVDRGVRMHPGEFSVAEQRGRPTEPALLNVQQREHLEKNDSFDSNRGPSNNNKDGEAQSVVPEGLGGSVVSNTSGTIKKEVVEAVGPAGQPTGTISSENPDGYVKGDVIKPANGSFLHVESGVIIPPAPNAILDQNTNTYVAGSGNGTVAINGDYVPPSNIEITNDGKIFSAEIGTNGETIVTEIAKPVPTLATTTTTVTTTTATSFDKTLSTTTTSTMLNQAMTDLKTTNQVENATPPTTNTTIRVKPGP